MIGVKTKLPSDHKVPSSIPGTAEIWKFGATFFPA